MARKVHSLQFKQEAVAMTRAPDVTVASVARSLGIIPSTLHYWINHPPGMRQRGKGNRSDSVELESDDPAALKLRLMEAQKQIRRLEMERDILKKATAYFASQNP